MERTVQFMDTFCPLYWDKSKSWTAYAESRTATEES